VDRAGQMPDDMAAAREYWASRGRTPFYETSHHWRQFIADRVAAYRPETVLEFGCNAGRNLVEVRDRWPGARLLGVDVNAEAVQFGIDSYGLDLHVAGEEYLAGLDDASVDVVFTVSVLDHLPDVDRVFVELLRVSRQALILLEPYTGRVDRTDTDVEGSALTCIPFTYTWDYMDLADRLGGGRRWSWTPYPLSSENMGPHYWLIEGTR